MWARVVLLLCGARPLHAATYRRADSTPVAYNCSNDLKFVVPSYIACKSVDSDETSLLHKVSQWYDKEYPTEYVSPYRIEGGNYTNYTLSALSDVILNTTRTASVKDRINEVQYTYTQSSGLTSGISECILTFQDFDYKLNNPGYILLTPYVFIYDPHCYFGSLLGVFNATTHARLTPTHMLAATPLNLTKSFYNRTMAQLTLGEANYTCLNVIEHSLRNVTTNKPVYSFGIPSLHDETCHTMRMRNTSVVVYGEWIESLGSLATGCNMAPTNDAVRISRDQVKQSARYIGAHLVWTSRMTGAPNFELWRDPRRSNTYTFPVTTSNSDLVIPLASAMHSRGFGNTTFQFVFDDPSFGRTLQRTFVESLFNTNITRVRLVNSRLMVEELTSYEAENLEELDITGAAGETGVSSQLTGAMPLLDHLVVEGGLNQDQPCPPLGHLLTYRLLSPDTALAFPSACSCIGPRRTSVHLRDAGIQGMLPVWATAVACVAAFDGSHNTLSTVATLEGAHLQELEAAKDRSLRLELEGNVFNERLPPSYCQPSLDIMIEATLDPCVPTSPIPWWGWTLIGMAAAGGAVGLGFGITAAIKAASGTTPFAPKKVYRRL